MLRLRVQWVLNAEQLRAIGSIVARYGDSGSADITTRQNINCVVFCWKTCPTSSSA